MTYEVAHRYFSGLVLAPYWERVCIKGEHFYQVQMWPAATSDPYRTWRLEEEWEQMEAAARV